MRNLQRFWLVLLLSASSVFYARAHASTYQPLSTIQASAEQHLRKVLPNVGHNIYLKATDLDDRLRLASCPVPLEVFLPSGVNIGNRVTTGIRCNQGTQWTIYVPVSIESEVQVLVLNKALSRNAAVGIQDIETRMQRVPGLGSSNLKSVAELTGQRLKRDLSAGTLLTPAMLQPEIVIRRGQQVTILASVSGIEVRTQGVALGDASVNSRIRVKNMNSAKVVEGVVDNHNMVRIDL
jgi:flagellar basal body P-ring formation protein FlgA